MNGLVQDLRYALRQMRKSPALFSMIVLTLGLGLGANSAIFSMVDWLLFRQLPIDKPEQMQFLTYSRDGGNSQVQFSYPEYLQIQKQTGSVFSKITPYIFGGLEGRQNSPNGLTLDGVTKPVQTAYVGGDFFSEMAITPARGRFILSSEEKSSSSAPIVLSYNYWRSRFGGDPAIVGRTAYINGHPVTIVGVTPEGFLGPTPIIETQAYLPLGMYSIERGISAAFLGDLADRSMVIFARVKSDTLIEQVQAVLKVVGQQLLKEYPRGRDIGDLRAAPLRPPGMLNGGGTNPLPILGALFLTLAAIVLGLACVNVANLFLVRALGRQREMAVRVALGAAGTRLIRQLLIEGLVVAQAGCVIGILVGMAAARVLSGIRVQTEMPFVLDLNFNWHVFAYSFVLAIGTGFLAVLFPAIRARQHNLQQVLHATSRAVTGAPQRLRGILVAIQVGGALTLLIVAGLFVRSLNGVQNADLGFNPDHVLDLTLDPYELGYSETMARTFYGELVDRVRALPGVQSASLASSTPLADNVPATDIAISGQKPPVGQPAPNAEYDTVSSGYFQTMGTALLGGRDFNSSDNETSPHVAVINKAMAERYWPGETPIGRSFSMGSDALHPLTIVGVVQNSRMNQVYGPFELIFYLPIAQNSPHVETLQIRSESSRDTLIPGVRAIAQSLAPAVPIYGVRTMKEALHGINGLLLFEVGASLAAALGILGLILAVVGVYGVMSYTANQRSQEIGLRIALGAQRRDILMMMGRRASMIVAVGVTIGLFTAFAVSRMLSDFLVGITPVDPATYVGVSALLIVVAYAATLIPARRAAKVDPMVALRYE